MLAQTLRSAVAKYPLLRPIAVPYRAGRLAAQRLRDQHVAHQVEKRVYIARATEDSVRQAFERVTKHLVDLPYPHEYRISSLWQRSLRNALARVGKRPNASLLAHRSLHLFDLPFIPLGKRERSFLIASRRGYDSRYSELIPLRESDICPPNTAVETDAGGSHSTKMDQAFSYYEQIYSGIPRSEPLKTIAEIGAGYGRFARVMHLLDPARRYIIIDLPESLAFSYAFLALSFPQAKRLLVCSEADAKRADTFDFVFCPVQLIEHLSCGSIDLVINTYSLGEMPQSSADYLTRSIGEILSPRYFYSLNTMFSDKDINQDSGGWDGEANEVTLNLEAEWRVLFCSIDDAVIQGRYRLTPGLVFEMLPKHKQADAIEIALEAVGSGQTAATRIANLYFAAKWSKNVQIIRRFFDELKDYCAACNFSADSGFDFDRIGEVRSLARSMAQ